ncbi:MAG: hypothetical protein ROO71_10580 [Balneola sp.]
MKATESKLRLFSLLFILTGLFFILLSLEIIPVDESTVNAPMWVIGLCGFVFSLGGIMMLLGEKSPLNHLLACLLVLSFGLISGWIAFFGDSAHFSGGTPFLSNAQNVWIARVLFGSGSVLCFAVALYAMKKFFSKDQSDNGFKK